MTSTPVHKHFTQVIRIEGRYDCVCNWCGTIATSPTQKGKMEQAAARHMINHGVRGVVIPEIKRRGPNNKNRRMMNANVVVQQVVRHDGMSKNDWIRYIDQNHLVRLGAGASRTVYALDDERVIKVETGGWAGQCKSEVARWNKSTPEQRQCLAAVLDSGDGWIIMERAKMTIRDFFGGEDGHAISRALTRETGIGDLHARNIGYFGKGVFKIIDYAL